MKSIKSSCRSLRKIINIIIIAFGASIIAEEWGFNVDGFVAGLGLGGLAFALAAKDTVSNFFGGIVIVTEKTFYHRRLGQNSKCGGNH
ncbi:mechanosensitive ion channel [Peribacillus frigoritolerans]|nr:mechanosensitive ion channel [Peribacillus frigoritolerans]